MVAFSSLVHFSQVVFAGSKKHAGSGKTTGTASHKCLNRSRVSSDNEWGGVGPSLVATSAVHWTQLQDKFTHAHSYLCRLKKSLPWKQTLNSLVEQEIGRGESSVGVQIFLKLTPGDDMDRLVITLQPHFVAAAQPA